MKYLITLFFLLFVFCPEVKAQEKKIPYGEFWLKDNELARYEYLQGYADGIHELVVIGTLAVADCECKKDELAFNRIVQASRSLAIDDFDRLVIARVMTDLYKDPANVYIPYSTIVSLAVSKLKGNNIDEDIIKARKRVNDGYEIRKQHENKDK